MPTGKSFLVLFFKKEHSFCRDFSMLDELPEDLKKLPAAERLALIGLLWDSLDAGVVTVSDAQLAELHRRANALAESRAGQCTWPDLRAELEQRLR